jgi:uncharacterized protein DUF3237
MLSVKEQLPGVEENASLIPLFRGVWRLAPYVILPSTPAGTRAVIEMPNGRLEGRGICAHTKGGANADWFLIGPDGTGTADARVTVETEDGAPIYLHGHGRCDIAEGWGGGTILRGYAHFETGSDKYRWLNKVHAVFRGVVVGDGAAGDGIYYDEYFEVR